MSSLMLDMPAAYWLTYVWDTVTGVGRFLLDVKSSREPAPLTWILTTAGISALVIVVLHGWRSSAVSTRESSSA